MNNALHLKHRTDAMSALRSHYGDDLVKGWAGLFCIPIVEDEISDDWWLRYDDHQMMMTVSNVRDGHGDWTGVKGETEAWVHSNADKIHDILWEMADSLDVGVWAFLEQYGDLSDECSWLLESMLKREMGETYNIPRTIGWIVGNEMTNTYIETSYNLGVGEE